MSSIEALLNSDSNLVFNFGIAGAGKTCFLATMYKFFYKQWYVKSNPKYNQAPLNRIENILTDMEAKKILPPPTPPGESHELDLAISKTSRDDLKYFTFLDMAGEDLNKIFLNGDLSNINRRYLEAIELNPIIICFVEYKLGSTYDRKIAHFFDYLDGEGFSFSNFALIITKWDEREDKTLTLKRYLKTDMEQTYLRVEQMEDSPIDRVLKFSIGNVQENQLQGEIDMTYCDKIADWLYYDAGTISNKRTWNIKELWDNFRNLT